MSYSHNQRKKNIKKVVKNGMFGASYVVIDGIKKTFKMVNGKWKLTDYAEPMTATR